MTSSDALVGHNAGSTDDAANEFIVRLPLLDHLVRRMDVRVRYAVEVDVDLFMRKRLFNDIDSRRNEKLDLLTIL